MDKRDVYIEFIDIIEKQWDILKVDGSRSLAPVGQNQAGVYQGYPMTIMDFPCIGIMPDTGENELVGSMGLEDVEFILQVYAYAFDFRSEESAMRVMDMDTTIDRIIKNNRNLRGLVDLTRVTTTNYGEFIRNSATGEEIVTMAAQKTIKIQLQSR